MDLLSLYKTVEKILVQLDFSLLFPGFKRYRFALYDLTQICLDRELIPYDERFLANTAIDYNGEYIAIWNVTSPQGTEPDAALLAYGIVHEMFHCFQHENRESRFPDDLKLLRYPDDLENYEQKYLENKYLAHAFSHCDPESLMHFYKIRNARQEKYSQALLEEEKAETVEGMAEFTGLKALMQIDRGKYEAIIADYLHKLESDEALLFDVRKISYYTGALFCLTLEKLGHRIENTFNSVPLFLQNLPVTESARIPCAYPELKQAYKKLTDSRQKLLAAHMADSIRVNCPAVICGYDPMNMFRVGNMLYCSHFVFLQNESGTIRLDGPVSVELQEGADRTVTGYYRKQSA